MMKNNWIKSISVILTVVLLLTVPGSLVLYDQSIDPFISGSVHATPV